MSDTVRDQDQTDPSEQLPTEAVVRVDIEAEPDAVWHALTTDDGLAGWLGDGSTIGDDIGDEIDVHDVVTGERKRGVLDEVTPGHRLGYTWWPETRPGQATRVAISLEPTHSGTRVTVVESRPMPSPITAFSRRGTPMASSVGPADWAWRGAMLSVSMRHRQPAMSMVAVSRA